MPIRVQCSCGAAFAAPDKYAGKTVKCPKCTNPLAIPAAEAAAAPTGAAAAPSPYAQPGRDLFSEAGIKSMPSNSVFCPGCGKPMSNTAVLCVQCGYHREKGRKLGSTSTGGAGEGGGGGGGHGGHGGDTVATTLARAAAALDEAKVEEAKTRSQGMPAWAYGGMLIGLLLLTYYMSTVGVGKSLVTLGILLILGSGLGLLYYGLLVLASASKEGAVQVLLICIPGYIFYYFYTHWDQVGNYAMMSLYMVSIAMSGGGFIYFGNMIVDAQKSGGGETELLRQLTALLA